MTENELLECVLQLARYRRWMSYHIRNSRAGITQGDTGFPDLVLLRPPRLVLVELKSTTGKLSDPQERWLSAFRAASESVGIEVFVWRPVDWLDGSIEKVLE